MNNQPAIGQTVTITTGEISAYIEEGAKATIIGYVFDKAHVEFADADGQCIATAFIRPEQFSHTNSRKR